MRAVPAVVVLLRIDGASMSCGAPKIDFSAIPSLVTDQINGMGVIR